LNKFKIFQVCFDEEQLRTVHHLFTPFDNTKNERPELREYHNLMRIFYEGHTKDVDLWGAFGSRWRRKLRVNASEIISQIENNPGHDVYLFNHCRVQGALTKNVWQQGEFHHKGITQVAKKALFICGYQENYVNEIMADKETVYSHYIVASNHFWKEYLLFLIKIKDALSNLPPEEKRLFESSANYVRDGSLNLFPFIIERMLSTYLVMNNFNVYHMPYDYTLYDIDLETADKLGYVNTLKNEAQAGNNESFEKWQLYRTAVVQSAPNLMHIDG
jgi:hypothetical protein